MRDIIIFTRQAIDREKCREAMISQIKNCEKWGETGICITKPASLYIDILNDRLSQAQEYDFDDNDKKEIFAIVGAEEVYINHVEYHRSIDVKRMIEAITEIDSSIVLYVDDEESIRGYYSVEKYINTKFEF